MQSFVKLLGRIHEIRYEDNLKYEHGENDIVHWC